MAKEKKTTEKKESGIKVTLGHLSMLLVNTHFNSAVEAKMPNKKNSYWLGRILDQISSMMKIYNKERQKIMDELAEKDDKGNIKTMMVDGPGQMKIADPSGRVDFGENQKKAEDAFEELNETEETIPFNKIIIKDDDLPNYSPGEWAVMAMFVECEE